MKNKRETEQELMAMLLILSWLTVGIIVGYVMGYVNGTVDTMVMATEVLENLSNIKMFVGV